MKENKKIIIIIAFIIILIIALITILILRAKIENTSTNTNTQESDSLENYYTNDTSNISDNGTSAEEQFENSIGTGISNNVPSQETDSELFFTIDELTKYYISQVISKNSEALIDVLNENFIKNNNVTTANLLSKVPTYTNYKSYKTQEEYDFTGVNFSEYYIKGIIDNNEVYFVIGMFYDTGAYDIAPISADTYKKYINGELYNESTFERKIQNKELNLYSYLTLEDKDLAKKYLVEYTKLMLNSPQVTYQLLDSDFKAQNFSTFAGFNSFIKSNSEKIRAIYIVNADDSNDIDGVTDEFELGQDLTEYRVTNEKAELSKYNIATEGGYKKITCNVANGSTFIFKINLNNQGDYTVTLGNN